MKSLAGAVPALVSFGPVIMTIGSGSNFVGHVVGLVGALMLASGAVVMLRMLHAQAKEIQELRSQLREHSGGG